MLNREEMKKYALDICIPVMERTANRAKKGQWAFKPDQVGYVPAFLENLCRPFWGIAPVLMEENEVTLNTEDGEEEIAEFLRKQLITGFSHGNARSWDKNREYMSPYVYENQNITELAGLALGMYFAREKLWDPLAAEKKQMISQSLYEMAEIAFDHSWLKRFLKRTLKSCASEHRCRLQSIPEKCLKKRAFA